MKTIGVLALQGAFREHVDIIKKLGHEAIEVRKLVDLNRIDGLILPGGESTAMGKLLDDFNLKQPLIDRIKDGLPTWGTCAGMILLAKEIEESNDSHLGTMSIRVRRNAYGRQLDSFVENLSIPLVSNNPVPLVFIRAPLVSAVGEKVEILGTVKNEIVAVREGHMLASSFHPELTNNTAFHEYFIEML